MSKLALLGGPPVLDKAHWPVWPEVTEDDVEAVAHAIRAGDFTGSRPHGSVEQLEEEWAKTIGAKYCVGVSNGTAAITLALAALGIKAGDEVIVPALSFIASALAVVHIGAIPIFADIDPVSFNLDPADVLRKITPRTRAIIPVHLHGLPCDIDEMLAIARAHKLVVVEDAAQAHGARYKDRCVGTFGDAATFSLSISKILPTCGEGGLVTTNSADVATRVRRLRQFGEKIEAGQVRKYEHLDLGWNNKIGAVQSAFTLSQLKRFERHAENRQKQTAAFLDRLSKIAGIVCPTHPNDRSHVWHILRFGVDPVAAGLPDIDAASLRKALQRVLQAEGCPVREYQTMPLPAQPIFFDSLARTWGEPLLGDHRYVFDEAELPVTCAVVSNTFVLQKFQQARDSEAALEQCAEAFEKVFQNLDFVKHLAQTRPFSPPWRGLQ